MADKTVRTHKKARNDLTAEYVRSLLHYDRKTGVLRWKPRPNSPTFSARYAGTVAGKIGLKGRIHVGIDYARYLAHRLAWLIVTGKWPEFEIDHIDGNPGNNAWHNLRAATSSQNLCNRGAPRHNTSGYKGVSWSTANNGWISRITKNKVTYHLGTFPTKEQAFQARIEMEFALNREFGKHY